MQYNEILETVITELTERGHKQQRGENPGVNKLVLQRAELSRQVRNGVSPLNQEARDTLEEYYTTLDILFGHQIRYLYLQGHTINLKFTTLSYKNKKWVKRPELERVRLESTHEPLIDQTTWNIVQDIRRHKRRLAKMAEQNMFSELLYCKDCGKAMVLSRAYTMEEAKNNFQCSSYRKRCTETCSGHYIREVQLAAILLDNLRRGTHFIRQNELLFAKHITQKNGAEIRRVITRVERELESLKRRDTELGALFKRLYEDNVLGKIPN